MTRILYAFSLLDHSRWHFNIASFGNPLQFGGHPYWIADVFQKVRADGKIKRLIRDRPRAPVAKISLNPPILRIPRLNFKFLMDVSVAAPAKIRKRHSVNHIVRSRERSSASANVNYRGHIRNGFQQSPGIFEIHTPSW
jgi:hypothetical protein